jgi:hypothetical protein
LAIYHLSVKTISRAAGRSATGAAAYRAAVAITDARTGEIHDYRRKGGVEFAELVLPDGAPQWASDRSTLWNAAERAETRKNSTVAREFEIALPSDLSSEERKRLAIHFARELVKRHRCAADVAIHAPGRDGDIRNHHAHILLTTRRLAPTGFSEKTRELDEVKTGEIARWRERFAFLQNECLHEAGVSAQVDHRSLAVQGIDRPPTRHLGPAASAYERRTGEPSRRRLDFKAEVDERLAHAAEIGRRKRLQNQAVETLITLETDIAQALRERDAESRTKLLGVEATIVGPTRSMLYRITEAHRISDFFRPQSASTTLPLTNLRPLQPDHVKPKELVAPKLPDFLASFFDDVADIEPRRNNENERPKY